MNGVESLEYDYGLLKSVGTDVFISRNVEIRRPQLITIGNHVAIDTGFYCTVAAEIGDFIHIAPYVTIIGGAHAIVRFSHFSAAAAGCRIICASDEHLGFGIPGPTIPERFRDKVINAPIVFEPFANLGTNVIVMPGITLGQGSLVGAGSVVTKSTKPWSIYIGAPAQLVRERRRDRMLSFARQLGYEFPTVD